MPKTYNLPSVDNKQWKGLKKQSIDFILNYSKSLEVIKMKKIKTVELTLN